MTDEQRDAARARCSGSNAPWWNGGRYLTSHGYVRILGNAHPFPESLDAKGYILEHRAVMEAHLGRPLQRAEVVHHINGNRQDNRIENLRLYASHGEHMRDEH